MLLDNVLDSLKENGGNSFTRFFEGSKDLNCTERNIWFSSLVLLVERFLEDGTFLEIVKPQLQLTKQGISIIFLFVHIVLLASYK